jgi:SAM-dependent methyltransferase
MSEPCCLACGGELAREPAVVGRDLLHGVAGTHTVAVCARCGSGTTLPPARPAELAAFYPASYQPHVVPGGPLAAVMAVVARARLRSWPLCELAAPGRALDVGCGRGDLGVSLRARGWSVDGVEPSAQACAVARLRGIDAHEGVLAEVELAEGSYDAVIFRHCLEHVVAPRADLALARRLLRPGGRVIVTLPNWDSWQRRRFAERWFPLELPRHRTHFTREGLAQALAQAGFGEPRLATSSSFICLCWSLQYRLLGRLWSERGARLWLGYAASAVLWPAAFTLDRLHGDGDFLHASAVRAS